MVKYFKEHIAEELEGALGYMEKAIEHKGTEFGTKFYDMSRAEASHANCLYKMFSSMPKPDGVSDADYSSAMKSIMDAYTVSMPKYEAMKKLYWGR